jgi:hypothetical protein
MATNYHLILDDGVWPRVGAMGLLLLVGKG